VSIPAPSPLTDTTTRIVRMVFPDQTNHHDTLFGGEALSLMASAASITAARRCRNPVVLAGSEAIDFRAPVPHGSIAEVTARVAAVGRTSVAISVALDAEDLLTGDRVRSTEGRFTFVAVDAGGRPVPITHVGDDPPVDDRIPEEPAGDTLTTTTTERVLPAQVNHLGTLFGGELVRLIDIVAFIAATRHTHTPMVTARFEQIDLRTPVKLGHLVELHASIVETRRTSLVVGVEVIAEEPVSGERHLCTSGRVVMAPARPAPPD